MLMLIGPHYSLALGLKAFFFKKKNVNGIQEKLDWIKPQVIELTEC